MNPSHPFSSSPQHPSSSSQEDDDDLIATIQSQQQALLSTYANNNAAMAYCLEIMSTQAINPSHGGSISGHRVIHRDREDGDRRLHADYFSENPKYNEAIFRRRFRMSRNLFLRIANAVAEHDNYFVQRRDTIGRLGLSTLQKVTAAFRILTYGVAADAIDEYIQIGESTAIESLKRFCRAVVEVFGQRYLRAPDANDVARLLEIGERRGFPGMLGSLDCMHWTWKNCPTAWAGQYAGRSREPTIVLEAVADYDLWIWHAHFGLPGSNNDINVLEASHLFANIANGTAPLAHYVIQGKVYDTGYYLADGIYPKWSTLVQTIHQPLGPKKKLFAMMQEACRKDVERAFGVLQSRFAIVKGPVRFWDKHVLHDIMTSCIIMHNMIIEDERDEQVDIQSWREAPAPEVDICRDERIVFEEFLARHRQIKNKEAHYALRDALIEHMWEHYGNSNN
ncbi:PREDICTED: putative nuclease HARBI1 [Ipomoea nil]|uniref:putative nuclease HARBI1 n=1 Tax=Ipomoea nil TaxID=35883 RepID=UPI000901761C|nr:PREDICTED: putative nuclease HARBI1 [Ipomoea nil]